MGGASMAAVHNVAEATGREARPGSRAPVRPPRADAAALRFASDRSMWAGGPPSAGGPEERGVAAARSIATKYKLSCDDTRLVEVVVQTLRCFIIKGAGLAVVIGR